MSGCVWGPEVTVQLPPHSGREGPGRLRACSARASPGRVHPGPRCLPAGCPSPGKWPHVALASQGGFCGGARGPRAGWGPAGWES